MSGDSNSVRRRGKSRGSSRSAGCVRTLNIVHPEPSEDSISNCSASQLKNIEFEEMGNKNNKIAEKGNERDKGLYLASDKVLDIIGYFNYSSIVSHGLDDYFHVSQHNIENIILNLIIYPNY